MQENIQKYIASLRKAYSDGGTEHSGRTALENLLNEQKPEDIIIQHEPGRQGDKGAPDFKIMKKGLCLGYIENKALGVNLDKVLKSNQIKRYIALSDNLIITDYLHWIWLRDGKIAMRMNLGYEADLGNKKFSPSEEKIKELEKLLDGFFSVAGEPITSPEILAEKLATRALYLRDELTKELTSQQKDNSGGKLFALYEVFRKQVFHELTLKEFGDAFAQMLAYSLFLARLNAGEKHVDLHNVKGFIPNSFGLIRELSDFLDEMENEDYSQVKWVIDEILSLINALDLAAIIEALSFQQRKIRRGIKARDEEEARLFERDPYIYFYEDFLAKYDPKTRETRGVYYTPPPVVNFIVRAIDDILKRDFNINQGLADNNRVTVLDFATGTGTFLVEIFERIFDNIGGADAGKADLVVREHILKNIYGFEFLLAPYTIAHLKLSQYLANKEHALQSNERLGIYLTNTLEPIEPQMNLLLPALSKEVELAQEVKDKPILVITGNPPYSGHSKNKGKWISAAIDAYKVVDGKPLGEKNPKWLNDDYVKFIRFAQMKMDAVDEGIVGIITNHSFIDNPTFRGMRQSLMNSFDQIYILDLHGNSKKKEMSPDGSVDQNVFDIQQGVAISLFVKKPGLEKKIFHADLWGKRLDKYKASSRETINSVDWQELEPVSPFYLFISQDRDLWEEYDNGWKVTELFPEHTLGTLTKRDRLSIGFSKQELIDKLRNFSRLGIATEMISEEYNLKFEDKDAWNLKSAIDRVRELGPASIVEIEAFRPFEKRWIAYDSKLVARINIRIMQHMRDRNNLAIVTVRQLANIPFEHVFVADVMTDQHYISTRTKEGGVVFPLYLYPPDNAPRIENISPEFRDWLDEKYHHHFAPETIMAYIYAVLHAPTYRNKYAQFLRIDFPRILFPDSKEDFEGLAELGQELIEVHLLLEVPPLGLGNYFGKGGHEVEKVRFALRQAQGEEGQAQGEDREAQSEGEKGGRIYINKTQYFAPVPKKVWEFHIGGYQVIDKYLKSRKGRKLSLDEINNITNICNALAFTIEQMKKIDDKYVKAFSAGK